MSRPSLTTGHVALNVTDLDRSLAFYRSLFDVDLLARRDDDGRAFALLGEGGRVLFALWQQSEGQFATDRPGLHHLAFEVSDVETVRRAEQVLREAGVAFAYDGVVPHGPGADSGGIFFSDPDGTRLEIYAPTGAGAAPAPVADAPTCGFF